MSGLLLYLDECVEHDLARAMRKWGHDVLTVAEAHTLSDEDEAQLLYALTQGRVFCSHNQLDFRRLHRALERAGRPHGGIILIPQTVPFSRLEIRSRLMLDWVSSFPDWTSRLFTWSERQQRIIHGYRLLDWEDGDVQVALG